VSIDPGDARIITDAQALPAAGLADLGDSVLAHAVRRIALSGTDADDAAGSTIAAFQDHV
jgi:hypothetical protein